MCSVYYELFYTCDSLTIHAFHGCTVSSFISHIIFHVQGLSLSCSATLLHESLKVRTSHHISDSGYFIRTQKYYIYIRYTQWIFLYTRFTSSPLNCYNLLFHGDNLLCNVNNLPSTLGTMKL